MSELKLGFNNTREDFKLFCNTNQGIKSEYHFLMYDSPLYVGFANAEMEFTYQCWLMAWNSGYEMGLKKDTRIGIDDKVDPELLSKPISEW